MGRWSRPPLLAFLMAALLLGLGSSVFATPLIEVSVEGRHDLERIRALHLDVILWGEDRVLVLGWPGAQAKLSESGLPHVRLLDDVETATARALAAERAVPMSRTAHALPGPLDSLNAMGGYPTLAQLEAWAAGLHQRFPHLATDTLHIGRSLEGRPIWVLKLSDNPTLDEDEAAVYLNAAIHAREVITPLLLAGFAEHLLGGYGTDPRIAALLDSREIWLHPVINPDGYAYNESIAPGGGGMWRKNRRDNGDGSFGVDLNRNYPFRWGMDDVGSSGQTHDADYRGAAPQSEPETRAVVDFVNGHRFAAVMNYHAFGNMILYPWGHTDQEHPRYDLYRELAFELNRDLHWFTGNGISLYPVNGDAGDWQAAGGLEPGGADYSMWSLLLEVGHYDDGPEEYGYLRGFWPSPENRDRLIAEQIEPLMRYCELAEDPSMLLPPPVPDLALSSTSGNPGSLRIGWEGNAGGMTNGAVRYRAEVFTHLRDTLFTLENAHPKQLSLDGWSASDLRSWSRDLSYHSGDRDNEIHTLTLRTPVTVKPGDTFRFRTWYQIEDNWDYAYVQIRTADTRWHSLPGSITTEEDPNGANRGHGITGSSRYVPGNVEGWLQASFPLDAYVGEDVLLRIVYATDMFYTYEGMYVDNLEPVSLFEDWVVLDTALTEPVIDYDLSHLDAPCDLSFRVKAVDAQNDWSDWSFPFRIRVDSDHLTDAPAPELPAQFAVSPLAPNPFNPTTRVQVTLPRAARLQVDVFNVLGKRVHHLALGGLPAGRHELALDGSMWSSGLYFFVVRADEAGGASHQRIRKALLLK